MLQRRYAAASLLLFVFLLTRAQLDHVALQPNRLCQRNAVRSHSSHTRQKCFIVLQLSSFAHDSIVTFCRSYPPESDRERRIRFVSEVNAMASIRSKHTVPLLGIMFGVQGQEDSLGLSIGTKFVLNPSSNPTSRLPPHPCLQAAAAGCRESPKLKESAAAT